jgi:hypothetical protein
MHWIATGSCESAAHFGWLVGIATGLLAAIVITILIATAPPLGPGHPARAASWRRFRFVLRYLSAVTLLVAWFAGDLWAGAEHSSCYAPNVAIGAAIFIGVVLMLGMLTAANQIGVRSVR